jgi:hypothetical protein
MKKLGIAALLAAGVVAASGVFAQEVKFDGYVNTGLGVVVSTEEGAKDPFIAASGVDSTQNVFRIRLHGSYTNEAGNAGAFLRLQASGGYNAITLPAAYGWVSAFNKVLTIKGGLVDDGTWNGAGAFFSGDQGEGLGALAKISPVDGLDLGVGAYLIGTPSESSGAVTDPADTKNFARDLDDVKYTFNLGYTLPDLVKITATYRPKSEPGSPVSSLAEAGVSLLAVPKLKAVLQVQLDNLQDFEAQNGDKDAWDKTVGSQQDDTADPKVPAGPKDTAASGKINIAETVQYDLGNLSVGLWSVQWLTRAEDKDLSLYVNPWVSYALGPIVPRLDLGYGSGAQANFNNSDDNRWYRTNYSPKYDSDYSVVSIRPSVKFNIDAKTFVEIGDLIDIDGRPKDEAVWNGDTSRISNVFYVDFKWSF